MAVKDKVVLVTGGARGMGREYVRGFLREGGKVIATDLSWSPSGASNDDIDFFAEFKDNPNVLAEVMDVTIDSHVKRVYDLAVEQFGTVDVIINNPGMRQRDLYPPHGSVTTLETEVKSLNERIEARKLVGRAKAILMEKHGLTEREAFYRIQTQSTALNKQAHEIARAIDVASVRACRAEHCGCS